jgi:hypothetical protein
MFTEKEKNILARVLAKEIAEIKIEKEKDEGILFKDIYEDYLNNLNCLRETIIDSIKIKY